MSSVNERRPNSQGLAKRLNTQAGSRDAATEAELYLAAGKMVRRGVRRGYHPEALTRVLGLTLDEGVSAMRFAESSPAFVLRALVEGWSWKTIRQRLGQQQTPGCDMRS